MSLNKLNYVDQVTVIPASNLNDIQDAIIELEGDVGEIETEIEGKADASSVYTKTEADALLNTKADSSAVYTKTETDTLLSGKASASDLEELEEEMTDYRQMYLDSLIHTTASGSIASFSDGADGLPMDFCTASIEPVQDLHGQSNPYPAGGGENKLNAVTSNMLDYGTYTNYSFNDATGVMSFSGNTLCGFIVPVLPSTQYTYSFKKSSTDGFAMRVREYSALPTSWSDSSFIVQSVGSNKSASGTVSETFTTTATTTYIIAAVYRQGETTETLSEFQVELGSTATAWSPYSNICPISGWTGAEVVRSGRNLWNPNRSDKELGYYDLNGTFHPSVTYACLSFPCSSGDKFVKSGSGWGGIVTFWDGNTFVSGVSSASVTVPANVNKAKFSCLLSSTDCQLEKGSTATAYKPYTADTYSVTWESEAGTVYGGSVDLVSGVLTVTHGYIASYNGETLPSTWISDRDVYAEGTTPTIGAEVVYELATPTTYQLTPQEITTLLGSNNVWSDTGDTSVGYVANTKLYIDSKLS